MEVNLPFLSVLLNVFEGNFQVQAPRGNYIWRGDLTEGFLRYDFGGLIHGGDYFRNFTVRWFGLEGDVFPQFITKLFLFDGVLAMTANHLLFLLQYRMSSFI